MKKAFLVLGLAMVAASNVFGAVWYVDKNNTSGTEDGTSWATAFTTVQDGIVAAFGDSGGDVWVAEGTYDEVRTSPMHNPAVDTGSVVMEENVHLYGGFAGYEGAREERDWVRRVTTIDGSTSRFVSPDYLPAYHAVVAAPNATLDGFTITGGNADDGDPDTLTDADDGGGLYNDWSESLIIANCTFLGNAAYKRGGGLYNTGGPTTVSNCKFIGNEVSDDLPADGRGGAIYWYYSSGSISGCTLDDNDARTGGAMFIDVQHGFAPTVSRCMFSRNDAYYAGAVFLFDYQGGSTPKIENCVFWANRASGSASAIDGLDYTAAITNCTFANNSYNVVDGVVYGSTGTTITNCILWNMSHSREIVGSGMTVTYCDVRGGYSGVGNISADPRFADYFNGDLRLLSDNSPCIDTGTASGAPLMDIRGVIRPQGAGYDMGAHEYSLWYVDKGNTGAEDGTSWGYAFNTIQEGINAAAAVGGGDVWIAEGSYNEQRTSPVGDPPTNTGSVVMKVHVDLYGGFTGSETMRADRDWRGNVTTIDGSAARGGQAAYYVVIGADRARLDGFAVVEGNANGEYPFDAGGGLYNYGVSPTIANCTFASNAAESGAGMFNDSLSSPAVSNCMFLSNSASAHGGGMSNQDSSWPVLTNCVFGDNSAEYGGGIYNEYCSLSLLNCTFSGNGATQTGGAMKNMGCSPTITNCILWGDSATVDGNEIYNEGESSPVITYSDVAGGYSGEGNLDQDPLFEEAGEGDLRLTGDSPCIDAGTWSGAPMTDILGVDRPERHGYDMGAYEYNKQLGVYAQISPEDFSSTGPEGGPFAPSSKTYLLRNWAASSEMYWEISNAAAWLAASQVYGTLDAAASVYVEIYLTDAAKTLEVGEYTDTVDFWNVSAGEIEATRNAGLTVNPTSSVISGTVTFYGYGLAGATLYGLPGNPVTNSEGYYEATVTYGWSATVTPVLDGYYFTPESRSYSDVTNSQSNQNYTAGTGAFALRVTSEDGFVSSGPEGGPFDPTAKAYEIYNTSAIPIDWQVSNAAAWLAASQVYGALEAVASVYVDIYLTDAAKTLEVGEYTDTVDFWNMTAGQSEATRDASLTVNPTSVEIAGSVVVAKAGLEGVLMDGLPGDPRTDGEGQYSAEVPLGWSGTVTPTMQGCIFAPPSRTYSDVAQDLLDQDYSVEFTGNDPPVADFEANQTSGPPPLTVVFADRSESGTLPITSWSWDFGDQSKSGQPNPSHVYTGVGTYTVSLTVTTGIGSDTKTKTDYIIVGVGEAPSITDQPDSATVDPGNSVTFSVTATGTTPLSYLWRKDGAGIAGATASSHTITSASQGDEGLYACRVSNSAGSVLSDPATLTVNDPPDAAFTADRTSGFTPLSVRFTDQSTPGSSPITGWSWSFGDDATSNERSPRHVYTAAGSYTVSLTVTSQSGLSDTETKSQYITVEQSAPVLSVIPRTVAVGPAPGSGLTIEVRNTGVGVMEWIASVTHGGEWLSITLGESGLGTSGRIVCSYADNTLESERTATIRVTAAGADNSPVDVTVVQEATPEEPDRIERPVGLEARAGVGLVMVFWQASASYLVVGHNVYRSEAEDGPYALLNTGGPVGGAMYQDNNVVEGTRYYYKLKAVDADGNESEFVGPASAVAGIVHVWVPDVSAEAGEDVRIPINVLNAMGINSYGIDIDFRYDPGVIDPDTVRVERTAITAGAEFDADTTEPGRVVITARAGAELLRGEGHLFDVHGSLRQGLQPGEEGTTRIERAQFYDAQDVPLGVDHGDTGIVTVTAECKLGDLDGNGKIEEEDADVALEAYVGSVTPNACLLKAGDFNGDGLINCADAVMILRFVEGLNINPSELDDPDALKPLLEDTQEVAISVASVTANRGDTVDVALEISDATGLAGFEATVSFPPDESALELKSMATSPLTHDFRGMIRKGPGYLRISMSRATAIGAGKAAQPGSLVVLSFEIKGTAPENEVLPIKLNGLGLRGQYGDGFAWYTQVRTTDGQIKVNEDPEPLEPRISLDTAAIDFGELEVGYPVSRFITVSNTGTAQLMGTATTSPPFGFVGTNNQLVPEVTYVIAPGENVTVEVLFAPAEAGDYGSTLVFTGGGGAQVDLTGSSYVKGGCFGLKLSENSRPGIPSKGARGDVLLLSLAAGALLACGGRAKQACAVK